MSRAVEETPPMECTTSCANTGASRRKHRCSKTSCRTFPDWQKCESLAKGRRGFSEPLGRSRVVPTTRLLKKNSADRRWFEFTRRSSYSIEGHALRGTSRGDSVRPTLQRGEIKDSQPLEVHERLRCKNTETPVRAWTESTAKKLGRKPRTALMEVLGSSFSVEDLAVPSLCLTKLLGFKLGEEKSPASEFYCSCARHHG